MGTERKDAILTPELQAAIEIAAHEVGEVAGRLVDFAEAMTLIRRSAENNEPITLSSDRCKALIYCINVIKEGP